MMLHDIQFTIMGYLAAYIILFTFGALTIYFLARTESKDETK